MFEILYFEGKWKLIIGTKFKFILSLHYLSLHYFEENVKKTIIDTLIIYISLLKSLYIDKINIQTCVIPIT